MHQAELGRMRTRSRSTSSAPFDAWWSRSTRTRVTWWARQVVSRVITEDYYVRFALPPDDDSARTPGRAVDVELPNGEHISAIVSDVQPEVDAAAQLVFARPRLGRRRGR